MKNPNDRLTDQEVAALREEWRSYNQGPFEPPNNGEEARSIMVCFAELQGINPIIIDTTMTKKYGISRKLAVHYETDVSDLLESLTKEETGGIGCLLGVC